MNGAATRQAMDTPPSQTVSYSSKWLGLGNGNGRDSRTKQGGLVRQTSYVLIDLLMVSTCSFLVYWLRFGTIRQIPHPYNGFLVLYGILIVLTCAGQDLYRTPREWTAIQESLLVAKAVGLASALLVLFIFTSGSKEVSRLVVVCSGAANIIALSGWRYAKRIYVSHRLRQGIGMRRALIIGSGKVSRDLASCFDQNHRLGYTFCGFLDFHPNGDRRVIGDIKDFRQIALRNFADEVFITLPAERDMVKQIFLEAQRLRLHLHIVPDLYDEFGRHAPIRIVAGFPMLSLHGQIPSTLALAAKRLIDIIVSFIGLVLCAPVLVAAAIWIRIDSPGPIFYSALRVGRKGSKFHCHKLRTMVADAEAQKVLLRQMNQRSGPFFKLENDPRVTRSGRWLRKYSIDEIPQLFNVLLGEMSLVGPRPHPIDDYERYTLEHLRRLDLKPGMTGLWQVTARRDPAFETNMKLDLEYIENWSLRKDFGILLKTIPAVLRAEGS